MNKIHKSLLLASLFGAGALSSCDKTLDINTDPTRPSTVTTDLVLPAGTGNVAYVMGGNFNIIGNFFAQHWTENLVASQYKDYDRYRIYQSTNDRDYQTLFAGGLKNLRYVMDHAKGDSSNYAAIAGLESAYTFQVLTDAFDKVPFTEALQGANNTQPKFDEGPVVYDGIIAMINQSVAKINADGVNVGQQDIVFGGNMDQWRRFANTLKLKIFLRQVYVPSRQAAAQDSIRAMYTREAAFLGATENAQVGVFSSNPQNGNPLYLAEVFNSSGIKNNIIASQTIIGYLEDTNDPRIDYFFDKPTAAGLTSHVGTLQGQAIVGGTDDISKKSTPSKSKIDAPSSPVIFISGAESLFLQAEASLRGLGAAGNAKSLYNAAITASFARLGVPQTTTVTTPGTPPVTTVTHVLDNFLASPDVDFNNTPSDEAKLERIITQKWVSMSGTEGFEMWTELRRTKYPSFVSGTAYSDLPGKTFAKRLIYPISETSRNANAPQVELAYVPVWWDKK